MKILNINSFSLEMICYYYRNKLWSLNVNEINNILELKYFYETYCQKHFQLFRINEDK